MHHRFRTVALAGLLTLLLGAPTVQAIQPQAEGGFKADTAQLPAHAFNDPALQALPSLQLHAERDVLLQARLQPFQQRYGGSWEVRWDERNDRPNIIQGSGIALIPGRGNSLTPQQFGFARESDMNLGTVAAKAREFIASVPELLDTAGLELALDANRSVQAGGERPVWFVEFAQSYKGVPVDGAYVFVRVAQGNIVQFGAERVAAVNIDTQPALNREEAFKEAWELLHFPLAATISEFVEPGELRIYPMLPAGDVRGERFSGVRGSGYRHVLAWRYVFRLKNDEATYEILVDANDNRVLQTRNLTVNVNATVTGGVYPTTNTDPEVVMPLPFAAVTNGTAKVTDSLGIYDYSGGSSTVTLDGKYFKMVDNCGAISLANSTDGNIAFGTSGGTDCTTPGTGGAGNTHATRTGYYHLTRINEKARAILTTNTWLQSKVTANMNVNNTCNASWGSGQANFYKSGPSASNPAVVCSNTGEIAAVFLHEWGHGMDSNSGGAASENGSGEAVGDTFAFLETRDSCIGQNFRPGVDCANCVACSGVRDVADFGVSAPPAKIATPANLANDAGINCDRYACPYLQQGIFPYQGPMGYEGHCESYIASGANWDLTQALIARHGASGWGKMDRIWYSSLTPSKSAYRVSAGGTCNVSASVDGCGANNWYTVFLPADDDDGNLANGTPNACRIWDAFNAHGIACGTRPVCSGDAPDFRLQSNTQTQSVCAPATATFNLAVQSDLGFTNAVTLSGSGNPAGSTLAFSPNPVTPADPAAAATLTVTTAGIAATGSSTITVNGAASGSSGHSTTVQLNVAVGAPSGPTLNTPANNATLVDPATPLVWTAVPGASGYVVEVATDAGFATIVATQPNATGTSWTPTGLQALTTYYWRVRANNICGAGSNSTVFTYKTAPMPGGCDETQTANSVFSSNVEGDVSGWTTTGSTGSSTWAVSSARPSSPTKSWLATDLTTESDQRLISPAIVLPAGENPLSLSFMSDINMEPRSSGGCYDGGLLEISTDNGTTFTQVPGALLLTDPYTGAAAAGPANGLQVWCGTRAYKKSVVNLTSYAGQSVRLRFRMSTDTSQGFTPHGWYVDDINVQSCRSAPVDVIFANGFQL